MRLTDCLENVDSRYMKCVTNAAHMLGGCFHILDVLCFLQKLTGSESSAHQQAALNAYENAEFELFFKYVRSLPHITKLADEEPELSLLPSLSQQVHKSFKDTVYQVVWNNLVDCRNDWFPPLEGGHCQTLLREFKVKSEEFEIEDRFTFKYDDSVCTARLDQATAFSTFYTNETIYQMAGQECYIAIDVALAMSGSEAVVELNYSIMKTQSVVEGQSNDTLVQRTNVDWSFPRPLQCQETIEDLATLYLEGDKDAGLLHH